MRRFAILATAAFFIACEETQLTSELERGDPPACLDGSASDLCVTVAATGQGPLRGIDFAPNGDLYGVTEQGAIRRFRDADGDGTFEHIRDYASAFGRGGSLDVDDAGDYVYAGTPSGVVRLPIDPLRDTAERFELVVYGAPSDGPKQFVTLLLDGDQLYVHVGPRANAIAPAMPDLDRTRAVVKKFSLADFDPQAPFQWEEDGELIATGLAKTPAMAVGTDGKIYGLEHAMRGVTYRGFKLEEGNPADVMVAIEPGSAHGYPYCFFAHDLSSGSFLKVRDPRTVVKWDAAGPGTPLAAEVTDGGPRFYNPHDDAWCQANIDYAVAAYGARTEPMGLLFVREKAPGLPDRMTGGAIVALHASNEVLKLGDEVLWADPSVTLFGLAISPLDGSLVVSNDDALVKKAAPSPPNGGLFRVRAR